jgi:hypothetical protein
MITGTEPTALATTASQTPACVTGETGLDANTAALVSPHHHSDWISLGLVERERVRELLAVMQAAHDDDRGVVKALQAVALQNHGRPGWSFPTLRTRYYAWLADNRSWRALTLNYRHGSSLPAAFTDFLRTMVLREHRSRKQAIHRVRELWREGRPVPGYGSWREWFASAYPDREAPKHFAGDYPQGWGKSNLYDNMPSRVQHTLATRGRAAAEKMLPHIERDPGRLRFLELLAVDDFECDAMAIYDRKPVRVRGIAIIDVASRTHLAVGFKPAITGDEGRRVAITRADVQGLLRSVFETWGVPRDYPMTVLCENAAAAVTAELEASLDLFFNGQVRISRTGMLNHKTLANGFIERGGKPNEKGWIESLFNLMHNRAGNLPGQKGSRYDNAPGDLEAKLKYVAQLAAYENVTDETWDEFRTPFMSFDELVSAYEEVFDWMDNRTEHKLLGFDEVREWRLGPGDMPKPMHLFPRSVGEQEKCEILPARKESPVERRGKLMRGVAFLKVRTPVLALLAFTARFVTVKNHRVTFTLRDKGYTYAETSECKLRTRAGGRVENGTEITGYFDEKVMARLYCFTRDGAYLGELERLGGPVDIKDDKAISEAAGQLARFYHEHVEGPVRRLLADDSAAADGMREHNNALVKRLGREDGGLKKRESLSKTLGRDTYDAPMAERAAAANHAARSIGAAAHCEAGRRRRDRSSANRGNRSLDALIDNEGAQAGNEATSGLERLC